MRPIRFHGDADWAVCKRAGRWRIFQRRRDGWVWHDSEDTLVEAHTAATQYAVADVLYAPGGLTRLAQMRLLWDAMCLRLNVGGNLVDQVRPPRCGPFFMPLER